MLLMLLLLFLFINYNLSFTVSPAIVTDIPLIDRRRIVFGIRLGSGAFGDVHLGFLGNGDANDENQNKVAIKCLRFD